MLAVLSAGFGSDKYRCVMEVEYFTKQELKDRGWTDSLIRDFLGQPDKTACNPRYSRASPVNLFLKDRVTELERSTEYQVKLEKTNQRRESSRKAVTTRKRNLLKRAEELLFDVPANTTKEELIRLASEDYNANGPPQDHENNWRPATDQSDQFFIERICVNYLRHKCTSYEKELHNIVGKTGSEEAYSIIKSNVLKAIATQYPWLQEACSQQLEKLGVAAT